MFGDITTGIRCALRASSALASAVNPVEPTTRGTPRSAQIRACSRLAAALVKSITSCALPASIARLRSSAMSTPSGSSCAARPTSDPIALDPFRSVPPTTFMSSWSRTIRTSVPPMRPSTPATTTRITACAPSIYSAPSEHRRTAPSPRARSNPARWTHPRAASSQQSELAQLVLQLRRIPLGHWNQGQSDFRAELAHQMQRPLHRNRIRFHEEESVQAIRLYLQLRSARHLTRTGGLEHVRNHPVRDVRRHRDDPLTAAGDERDDGEVVAREQGEALAALFDDVDRPGHVPRRLLDRHELRDVAQPKAGLGEQVHAGAPRNVVGDDRKPGMRLGDGAEVLEQAGLGWLV